MKKILLIAFLALFCSGCLTSDYNVRTIYDTGREYETADSTLYGMKWHDSRWLSKNLKYWRSSGIIITNWYNVFHGNDWLKKTIDGGFEGTIFIQQDHLCAISQMEYLTEGSFGKEYFNIQITKFSDFLQSSPGSYVYSKNENIIYNQSPSVAYAMNPLILEDDDYVGEIVELYTTEISQLRSYLGLTETSKVNFGILIDEYEYDSWKWADEYLMIPVEQIFDPLSLGRTYGDYTSEEKQTLMRAGQSNLIETFKNSGLKVIVDGTRITTELVENEDLLYGNIIGCIFEDVTLDNIATVESKVSSIRTYETPTSTEESLILIAGVKTDVYNQKPTTYAQLVRRITNSGLYFTSGSDGTNYWGVPLVSPGDWWVRSNKDSNWQAQVPTYASYTVHPRKMIIPMDYDNMEYYTNTWSSIGICSESDGEKTYTFPTNNASTDSGSIDFSFVYDEENSTYHIIQIPGGHLTWGNFITPPKNAAWFQHFVSDDLISWTKQPNINVYDSTYAKTNAWAPHIIKYNDTWYMYYTAVDASVSAARSVQRIMLKTSTDLYTWSNGIVVLEGDDLASGLPQITLWDSTPDADWDNTGACRDPFIIRNETNDGWLMFVSIVGNSSVVGYGGLVICIASSTSLSGPFEIIDYVRETTHSNYGQYNGESPQVWVEDGTYYLQWSTNDGTDPWINGAVLKTTTPSDGYINGNTWGAPATKFPYKGLEMLQLKNGERIFAYLKPHTVLANYFSIAFGKYIANPSGTDEFYYSMLPQCFDGNNVFTQVTVPLQPTGLTAVEISSTSVKLYWDKATYGDVYGYNIYRGTTSGGGILVGSTTNPRIYIDEELTPGQTYYYKISTVNHNKNISELSSEVNVTL